MHFTFNSKVHFTHLNIPMRRQYPRILVDFESSTVEKAGPADGLFPLYGLEVVPQYLSLHTLVRDAAAVGDGVGPVLQGNDALLLDLAVLGPRVDAVDDDAPPLLVKLSLEDPGVDIDRHLGDSVGTVRPALTLPASSLGQTLELSHQPVCKFQK